MRQLSASHPALSARPFSDTSHFSRPADLARRPLGHVTSDPEDLRCHTSRRRFFDDEMQLAARYAPSMSRFDPEALGSVAPEATGSGWTES